MTVSIPSIRRCAAKCGLRLHKSSRWDLGPFYLVDAQTAGVVASGLDEDQAAEAVGTYWAHLARI